MWLRVLRTLTIEPTPRTPHNNKRFVSLEEKSGSKSSTRVQLLIFRTFACEQSKLAMQCDVLLSSVMPKRYILTCSLQKKFTVANPLLQRTGQLSLC